MESTFMTILTKIHISSWLLNQIGWGFRRNADNSLQFYNPKAYSDWLTILKVIDADSPIVIFGGQYIYNDILCA